MQVVTSKTGDVVVQQQLGRDERLHPACCSARLCDAGAGSAKQSGFGSTAHHQQVATSASAFSGPSLLALGHGATCAHLTPALYTLASAHSLSLARELCSAKPRAMSSTAKVTAQLPSVLCHWQSRESGLRAWMRRHARVDDDLPNLHFRGTSHAPAINMPVAHRLREAS